MTKILLVNPGKSINLAVQEPLNLCFIAGYLEANGIEVKIVDEPIGQNVEKEISKFSPDFVGITATTPVSGEAYKIADMCKIKHIKTILGGVHASLLPQEALEHADFVVVGEGEIAVLDILNNNNITSRIVSRPYIRDIDTIPIPARHLIDMEFYLHSKDRNPYSYLYFVPEKTLVASLFTSRGCPYNCTFCHNSWRNIPTRYNSPERVILEIKHLIEKYNVKTFFFIEDNLFVNKKRLITICKLIIENKLDIIWGGNARVDNIDLEILQLAKEAGCKQVTFGFESGSQRILNILNKKTTVEQNKKAIELCNQVGLIPQGTFMIGNPTETIEDIMLTKKFIEDNNIECVGTCITIPFPGTDIYKWCEERNLIPKNMKWDDFTFDKNPIHICESISPNKLKELQLEINRVTFLRNKSSLKIYDMIINIVRYPSSALNTFFKVIKNPSNILNVLKRFKYY